MNIIYSGLGEVLKFIYGFTNNFGIAIIIFTLLIRVVLLPLMVKQQKSMAHMQKMQPLLNNINKKYQNDKAKLNEETMKLYKEHNINPMGGCLPLFIQMPILIAVYGVIQNPITYILKLSPAIEVLTALCEKATDTQLSVVALVSNSITKATELLTAAGLNAQSLLTTAGDTFSINQLIINFNFLGLNLGLTPKDAPSNYALLILPVLGAVTTYLSSKITAKQSTANQNSEQATQMQTMQMIFPFMTGYFCYILPGAMGLYWIIGNLIQILQSYTFDRYIMKKAIEEPLIIEPNKTKKGK